MNLNLSNILCVIGIMALGTQRPAIDLSHWKLETPSGYKASDWKLSNFQKDRFAKPFFYLDSVDQALTMVAYPVKGKSTAKYTRCTLREQMQPGSSDVNWTFKQGGSLELEFELVEISKQEGKEKYHRTILAQIDGRTTAEQTEDLGLERPISMPFLKVYWENESIQITRRVLKDNFTVGEGLLLKESWKESKKIVLDKVGFEPTRLKIEVKKGRVLVWLNDEKPVVFRDESVGQWYFENYFTVGNYLQSKDANAYSKVKYYQIDLQHED